MKKPRLLDLFCGAGGAGEGYSRAGFEVVGVDNKSQPHYPFEFHHADALEYPLNGFDAIHASPPCQKYTTLKGLTKEGHPDLVGETRKRLKGHLYVIENVYGAPLENPIRVCGSAFGLGVWRHRYFESPGLFFGTECRHKEFPAPLDVTGTGGPSAKPRQKPGGGISRKPKNLKEASLAMGIDWMTRKEIAQAIPPAYTEWIGKQIITMLIPGCICPVVCDCANPNGEGVAHVSNHCPEIILIRHPFQIVRLGGIVTNDPT